MRMIEGPTLIFSAQWAIGKATMLALGFGLGCLSRHASVRPTSELNA